MPGSIELTEVSVRTASGRALFEGLNLRVDHEALDTASRELGRLSREQGPETVIFSCALPAN